MTTKQVILTGEVQATKTKTVSLNGIVKGSLARNVIVTGSVRSTNTHQVVLNGYAASQQTKQVVLNGYLIRIDLREVIQNGYIQDHAQPIREVTVNGFVYDSIKTVVLNGSVVPSLPRIVNVGVTGYVSGNYEVTLHGIVTTNIGTGRLVKWDSSSLQTLSGWRIAGGENVNGSRFITGTNIVPFEYVAAFNANIVGVAVCLDTHSPAAGEHISLDIMEGTNVLQTITLNNNAWISLKTTVSAPGWFLIPTSSPISQLTGHSYSVAVSYGTGISTLVTDGLIGKGGVVGPVLNCVVTTDQAPTSLDTRPMFIIPQSSGATLGSLDVSTATIASDAIYTGVNAILRANVGEDVAIAIGKLLNIGPKSQMILSPNAGKKHLVSYAIGAGTLVYGSLQTTGHVKDRYKQTLTGATQSSQEIVLNSAPSGWLVEDKIYVGSSDNQVGTICTIASISSNRVTTTQGIGRTSAAGAYVINMSRDVAFRGYGAGQKASIAFKGDASLTASYTEFTAIGQSSTLSPDLSTVMTLSEVIINDTQFADYDTSGTNGLLVNSAVTATDITIVRSNIGIVSQGQNTLSGTTLLAACFNAGIFVKTGKLIATVISTNMDSGAVNMSGNTSFKGSVINRAAKSLNAVGCLIRAQGLVNDVQLTGGTLISASGQQTAVIGLDKMSGVNHLYGFQISSDAPYVYAGAGSLYVGNARLVESVTTASSLAYIVPSSFFISLIDEDGVAPATGLSSNLGAGSRVANRYRTELFDGAYSAINQDGSGLIMKVEHTTVEVARIGLNNGEIATFSCNSKGAGRFLLESSIAPDVTTEVNNVDFTANTFTTTATAIGIIVISFQADTTAYIDRLVRTV